MHLLSSSVLPTAMSTAAIVLIIASIVVSCGITALLAGSIELNIPLEPQLFSQPSNSVIRCYKPDIDATHIPCTSAISRSKDAINTYLRQKLEIHISKSLAELCM